MKSVFCIVYLQFITAFIFALPRSPHSAVRKPSESYFKYIERYETYMRSKGLDKKAIENGALKKAVRYDQLNISGVTKWMDDKVLKERFEWLRDYRFIPDESHEKFLRRNSWLYPDDGCFARADVAKNLSAANKWYLPNKLFIFGNLRVNTSNHPSGYVSWWFHVVPIVKIEDHIFVIDPAINPNAPLAVKDWILKQVSKVEEATFSICNPHTYVPSDDCNNPTQYDLSTSIQLLKSYLGSEWQRQIDLKRDPQKILGASPPWLKMESLFLFNL